MSSPRDLNAVPLALPDASRNRVAEAKDEEFEVRERPWGDRLYFLFCGLLTLAAAGGTGYAFYYPGRVDAFTKGDRDVLGWIIGIFSPVGFLLCSLLCCKEAARRDHERVRVHREAKEPDVVVVETGDPREPYAFVDASVESNRDNNVPPAHVATVSDVSQELLSIRIPEQPSAPEDQEGYPFPMPSIPGEPEGIPLLPFSPRRSVLPFFKPEGFSSDSEEPGAPLQLKIDRRKSFP